MRRRFAARSKRPPEELEAFLHPFEVLANFVERERLGHRVNLSRNRYFLKRFEVEARVINPTSPKI